MTKPKPTGSASETKSTSTTEENKSAYTLRSKKRASHEGSDDEALSAAAAIKKANKSLSKKNKEASLSDSVSASPSIVEEAPVTVAEVKSTEAQEKDAKTNTNLEAVGGDGSAKKHKKVRIKSSKKNGTGKKPKVVIPIDPVMVEARILAAKKNRKEHQRMPSYAGKQRKNLEKRKERAEEEGVEYEFKSKKKAAEERERTGDKTIRATMQRKRFALHQDRSDFYYERHGDKNVIPRTVAREVLAGSITENMDELTEEVRDIPLLPDHEMPPDEYTISAEAVESHRAGLQSIMHQLVFAGRGPLAADSVHEYRDPVLVEQRRKERMEKAHEAYTAPSEKEMARRTKAYEARLVQREKLIEKHNGVDPLLGAKTMRRVHVQAGFNTIYPLLPNELKALWPTNEELKQDEITIQLVTDDAKRRREVEAKIVAEGGYVSKRRQWGKKRSGSSSSSSKRSKKTSTKKADKDEKKSLKRKSKATEEGDDDKESKKKKKKKTKSSKKRKEKEEEEEEDATESSSSEEEEEKPKKKRKTKKSKSSKKSKKSKKEASDAESE